jgi:hypothetical protein
MTMSFFSHKYGIAHCHFCLFEKKFFNRHFGMTNAQTQEGIGLENAAAASTIKLFAVGFLPT